jgi:hypothetical protein
MNFHAILIAAAFGALGGAVGAGLARFAPIGTKSKQVIPTACALLAFFVSSACRTG